MQVKHGIRSDLRSPGRSGLSLFLFFLVMALLGTSLGTVWSVRGTLRTLSRSYVTIATAVLDTGTETPDYALMEQTAEEMDALPLPEGALSWSPNRYAQAWLPEAPELLEYESVSLYGVVLVRTMEPGPLSSRNTLPAGVLETLFSTRKVTGQNLELYGESLAPGKNYLVYGQWYSGYLGYKYCMEALRPPLEIPDPDNWQQTPGAREYLELAERMQVWQYSVRALFPEDPSVSLPFQQKAVQLTQGRSFTPQELAEGARVCMISEKLAKLEKYSLGDRIPLSLAVGNDPERSDSYDPARGFDLEAEFEIVGLLYAKDDWKNTIFLPPQKELDMSQARRDSVLGQYLLDNDAAEAFLRDTEGTLPPGVQINLYDQGYSEAAAPLRLMLRTVSMISLVCLAAGLCFLLLNLWLFVSRQRQVGVLMHRLGTPRFAIPLYFLSAMLPLALPALAGGVGFSQWAAGLVTRRLARTLASDPGMETRFSDAKLSLKRTAELIEAPVSLYLAAAGILLLLSILLCWFLAERTVPGAGRKRQNRLLRTRTRTQALRGGASKYALLSARRGGFRSAVTLLAPLAAVLLLCGLNHTRTSTALRLQDISENTEIRGYFTDINGTTVMRGNLRVEDVLPVTELPQATRSTVTWDNNIHFRVVSALEPAQGSGNSDAPSSPEGGETEPTPHYTAVGPMTIPEIPYNNFQASLVDSRCAREEPSIIFADSMQDVPQLMFRGEQVRWLEGCSDANMRWSREELFNFYKTELARQDSWEAEQRQVLDSIHQALEEDLLPKAVDCVVSDALLEKWKLSLGGYFLMARTDHYAEPPKGNLRLAPFRVIGVYHGDSYRDPIFCRALCPIGVDEAVKEMRRAYEEEQARSGTRSIQRFMSAVFRFKASELDSLRASLAEAGLTEVGDLSGLRRPFLLEDQVFLATKRSVERQLWYMDRIFPVVSGLVLLLALVLSVLQLLARRREIWLMHCMGTGRAGSFGSLFTEQAGLCLLGLAAGLGICSHFGLLTRQGLTLSLLFGGLWLFGVCGTGLYLTARPRRIHTGE